MQEEFDNRITAAMSTQRIARYEQIDAAVSTRRFLRDDEMPIARAGSFAKPFRSVRGYGLRTYEPRQGRNAATVV